MRIPFLPLALLVLLAGGCHTTRPVVTEPVDEVQDLPELVVTPDLNQPADHPDHPYRATPERPFDLLHTALDLSFDMPKRHVLGKARLQLTPLAFPQDTVSLDAVGFLIHDVRREGAPDTLPWLYDGRKLNVLLPRTARKGDTLWVSIHYTARPDEVPSGGSAAIRSDNGLFFINPDGQYRDKPVQIWTQGETQSNSRWFPTFDQPNERCTQEVRLTVDTLFETLSNGLLIGQQTHADGTRTDTWRLDLPHAPYLFMLAIGDYAVTHDTWRGIPVGYYVEHDYAADARAIFPEAPAMLSYFSDYTGIPYPWPKYSQVVVRDYVSGAMENTTAVVYGEFMQATGRELIDERRNEAIGAHELIHHWFGDLVTCESWSQLVLNEGFANYGEYLWLEFKYGTDEAEYHRRDELEGYLQQASVTKHPLVDFHYASREDMFDAHSYNKGGLVLHMLRKMLGESVFRAGLHRYLKRSAWGAVEIHDLRLALEEASGRDLNWFFDQWYMEPGHPELTHTWSWDPATRLVTVEVMQVQDPGKNAETYILPTEVAFLMPRDRVVRMPLVMTEREQTFTWELEESPLLVDLDPDRTLLAVQHRDWSGEEAAAYWRTGPCLWTRIEIMGILEDEAAGLEPYPWGDAHWTVRAMGTSALDALDPVQQLTLADLARQDPHSSVRESALGQLAGSGFPGLRKLCLDRLEADPSYSVLQTAIGALSADHPELAREAAEKLEADGSITATLIAGDYYAGSGATDRLPFFESAWERVNGLHRMFFTRQYAELLRVASPEQLQDGANRLAADASDQGLSPIRRFGAFRALAHVRQGVQESRPDMAAMIGALLERIRTSETDEDLLRYYEHY